MSKNILTANFTNHPRLAGMRFGASAYGVIREISGSEFYWFWLVQVWEMK
jgi:hypothetical protein